jgi:transcriptional regulator with XRE-family HTH domain
MSLAINIKIIRHFRKKSVKELAKKLEIAPQSIYEWERGLYEPNKENLEKLSSEFQVPVETFYRENLTKDYLEKLILNENSTNDYIGTDYKQKQIMTQRETFYIDLIEKNEEYNLIPRAVLKDYKIVPDKIIDVIIQSNENEKKALVEGLNSKYELMIQGYKNKIADLESEINRLRNR